MRTSISTSTNETENKTRSRTSFRTGTGLTGRYLVLGAALGAGFGVLSLAGCKSNPASTTNPADGSTTAATDPNATDPNAADPTAANLAPASGTTQVAGYQEQAQPTEQSTTAAPVERRAPSSSAAPAPYSDQGSGQSYAPDSSAEAGYDATLTDLQAPQPPPPLPEYAQPPAPDPNYLWTPGYWNYAPQGGYYWVPGAWTQPPYTGALWTPGYWGGYGSGYRFHRGFWGPHIGFYGGVNYGFGYVGVGYQGGYWNGPHFFYNQYANNINININPGFRDAVYQHNVMVDNRVINNRVVNNTTYNNTTINNTRINNVSYNGGNGGIQAKPRPAELAVLHEQRTPPMKSQVQVREAAAQNKQQFFTANKGRPVEVAAAHPLVADRGIAPPPHTTAQLVRTATPQGRPQEQARPVTPAETMSRPAPEAARPQPTAARPAVEARPAQPAARPVQPEARPTPPQPHPAAAPAAHPQPQQARPAVAAHPQPEARPAPAVHPAPQAKSAPAARPVPQARPAPAAKPAPAPHPQARPAPPAHPESKPAPKPEQNKEPRR